MMDSLVAMGLYAIPGSDGGDAIVGFSDKVRGGTNSEVAYLEGNVDVVGSLAKSGGPFKIDHPSIPPTSICITPLSSRRT